MAWRWWTRASRAGVEASKSSERLAWLADMSRPASTRSPEPRAEAHQRTRSHSVTTWGAPRRGGGTGQARRGAAPQRARGAEPVGGRLALGPPGPVGGPVERPVLAGMDDDDLGPFGDGHRTDREVGEVDEESRAFDPGHHRELVHETGGDPGGHLF